jgi:predicted cupin superfamily sugar epimerase/uncharacterized protein (DUF952 family)
MTDYLLHLVAKKDIAILNADRSYTPESYQSEGFIHLCTHDQVHRVVELFYPDSADLFVAVIAPGLLHHQIVYEQSNESLPSFDADELFPHYYKPLNTDAIIDFVEFSAYKTMPISAEVIQLMISHRFNRLPVEGTLYRQTWQSIQHTEQGTPIGTAMVGLFCVQPESASRFHKLTYDEVWHFYKGSALELYLLHQDGTEQKVTLGHATERGEHSQFLVPAGVWQAGRVVQEGEYALYGCTMAPGFHVECFEAATVKELSTMFPNSRQIIKQLAIPAGDKKMHKLPPAKQ